MAGLERGAVFGKYRILDLIGRGGMGVVYLAEDTLLGRQIALKLLDRGLTSLGDFEERFREEARTLAALKHPNIVQIHNLEKIEEQWAIDMEYVERGSLADAESAGGMTVAGAVVYVHQVLQALACCHHAGIVHRDVKPSNILIARDDRALLSDFGLAKLMSERQKAAMGAAASSSFFMGTPRYAPPESWEGQAPTPAWDVYSVGAVLYEAVSAKPPYEADSPFALVKLMAERSVPPLAEVTDGVSRELSEAVAAMLARNPAERPQDAEQALRRIGATPEFLSDRDRKPATIVHVRPPAHGWMRADSRRVKRRARVAGLVAALAVMAVLVGVYWRLGLASTPGSATTAPALDAVPVLFNTVDPVSQETWENHWYMKPGTDPDTWNVAASKSTDLWFLQARKTGEEALSLSGSWAEYSDKSALVFRHGSVEGEAYWRYGREAMTVTLRFQSAADGYRWTRYFLLERSKRAAADREFVEQLEGLDCVQCLVYSELIPRNLAWAESFERIFFEPIAALTTAPRSGGDTAEVYVDGRLSDAGWLPVYASDGTELGRLPARLAARPDGARGQMLVRYDEAGLYAGLRVEPAPPEPVICLALLPVCDVPVMDSPRWIVEIAGGEISRARYVVGGRELPWECPWQVAAVQHDGCLEAELFIPFDQLGEDIPRPGPGTRWRANAAVKPDGTPDAGPDAYWGSPDTTRAECGAIIVFGPKSSPGPAR